MTGKRHILPARLLPAADTLETVFAVAVQATLIHRIFSAGLKPDLVYLLLAHKAFTRNPLFVLLLAFGAEAARDGLNPGRYFGTNILAGMTVVMVILAVRGSIPSERRLGPFLLVLAGGALLRNTVFAVLSALKGSHGLLPLLADGAGSALYTGLVGALILVILHLSRSRGL